MAVAPSESSLFHRVDEAWIPELRHAGPSERRCRDVADGASGANDVKSVAEPMDGNRSVSPHIGPVHDGICDEFTKVLAAKNGCRLRNVGLQAPVKVFKKAKEGPFDHRMIQNLRIEGRAINLEKLYIGAWEKHTYRGGESEDAEDCRRATSLAQHSSYARELLKGVIVLELSVVKVPLEAHPGKIVNRCACARAQLMSLFVIGHERRPGC
jgi:hypothetical protein